MKSKQSKHVIVFGGGVGGLTAAHELAERGYRVTVYEQRDRFGGKARSMPVPKTAQPGKFDLPGEHGFRFVPGFYKHLPDTMRRIPFAKAGGGVRSVVDNLMQATMWAYARENEPNAVFPTSLPTTLQQLLKVLWMIRNDDIGLSFGDVGLFARKLAILLTSCTDRRLGQWETIPWWDFVEASSRGPAYQKYLARGITRSLVAMKSEVSSTRTVGYILLQLMLSMVRPGNNLDRLLNGPTNDVWIDPWTAHLRELGVELHLGAALKSLQVVDGRIACASVEQNGNSFDVAADFFVSAMPVEVFREFLTDEMIEAAPALAKVKQLQTDWMNGVQFYWDRDVPEVHGHIMYIDSPWSLTSVSQKQFWQHIDLSQYANGQVRGVLSVDISDWETPGILYKKPARLCTREEIKEEVLAQVKHHLGDLGRSHVEQAQLLYWHLDPDIVLDPPGDTRNLEPLLINTINSWVDRPQAASGIPNLVLASDYVQTFTDLATMEGANEAARRAVNAVLDVYNDPSARCEVWPLREPFIFAPLRWVDRLMWRLGRRNLFDWGSQSTPSAAVAPTAAAAPVAAQPERKVVLVS